MNEIEPALRRAYALGQKYWQQADSDFARDNRKADETQAKFNQLVESMQGWLSPAEADNLRAQLAEAQAALKIVMRNAELSKEPCDPDPESPAAIRNGKFAGLASIAAQGLGMVRGPSLTEHLVEAQKDAERYSWLRMNRLWLKANLPTIAAPDFDDAIDAAKGEPS